MAQNERIEYNNFSVPRDGHSIEVVNIVFHIIKNKVSGEPELVICAESF